MPLESLKVLDIVSMVQPGDILAFSGQGNIVSDLVRTATGSIVSHVGIVLTSQSSVDDKPVQPKIIESTSLGGFQGVTVTDLIMRATYYPGFIWYLPLRLDLQKKVDPKKLEYWLLQQKGKQYDTWGAIESALLQWEQSEYWHKIASMSTELEKEGMNYWRKITSFYLPQTSTPVAPTVENPKPIANWFCSELAGAALQQVGVLPSTLDPDMIRPTDLVAMQIYSGTYYQIKGTPVTPIPEYNSKPVSGISVAFGGSDNNDIIFQKALASQRPEAILEVAQAFESLGEIRKARLLYEHIYRWNTTPVFGAATDKRSVSDLLDIVAAKDAAMINLANRVMEIFKKPEYTSSGTKDAYNALVKRYGQARDRAQKVIDKARSILHPTPLVFTDATDEYGRLLDSLNPHWRENKWAAGDWSYEDVANRLNALGTTGKNDIDTPQPMTIDSLQIANAAAHVVDEAAKGLKRTGQSTVQYLANTAGKALGSAAKGAGEGLGISTTNVILIGVATLASLFLLARMSSPLAIASHLAK